MLADSLTYTAAERAAGRATTLYVTWDGLTVRDEEWAAYAEYFCAPSTATGTYVDMRKAQGRADAWTGDYQNFQLAITCEGWNALFDNVSYPIGTGYLDSATDQLIQGGALTQITFEMVKGFLRASPYWTQDIEDKARFEINGFHTLPQWGDDARALVPAGDQPKTIDMVANYIGGWEVTGDVATLIPEAYMGNLNFHIQRIKPISDDLVASRTITAMLNGTYEGHLGYALKGLNGIIVTAQDEYEQDRVSKSVHAASASLASFMQSFVSGFSGQCVFNHAPGGYWGQYGERGIQGGVLYPGGEILQVMQKECIGTVYRMQTIQEVTQVAEGDGGNIPTISNAPSVSAFMTRNGSRACIMLCSCTIPFDAIDSADDLYNASDNGYRSVRVILPWSSASALRVVGYDEAFDADHVYNFHNFAAAGSDALAKTLTIHDQTGLAVPSGALTATLSPAATRIYIFDGVAA